MKTLLLVAACFVCLLESAGQIRAADALADENPKADVIPPVQYPKNQESIDVLFIGNSYTYGHQMPKMVHAIARSKRCRMSSDIYAVGGASLRGHWADKKVQAKLQSKTWHAVILQDQSAMPVMSPDSTIGYGSKFAKAIKGKGGRPVFFMTWGYRRSGKLDSAMQQGLAETYCRAAHGVGAEVAPVGLAWKDAMEKQPKLNLYAPDGSHPNAAGAYLTACVMFATIYNQSPVDAPRAIVVTDKAGRRVPICRIPSSQAKFLQEIAWETVSKFRQDNTIGQVVKRRKEAEARHPSIEDVKKVLAQHAKPFLVADAVKLWGSPHRKNEKQRLHLYQLKNEATLWLTFNDKSELISARVLPRSGMGIKLDVPVKPE